MSSLPLGIVRSRNSRLMEFRYFTFPVDQRDISIDESHLSVFLPGWNCFYQKARPVAIRRDRCGDVFSTRFRGLLTAAT